MTRRNPDYVDNSFEYEGKKYNLIEPKSFNELKKALRNKEMIDELIDQMELGDHQDAGLKIKNKQIELMQNYVNGLDAFNSSLFINNLKYLLSNKDMKISELELVLGLSTGYISRMTNKNSKKSMSIENVCKIASLFNVNIKTLIEVNMLIKNNNNALLIEFIQTIIKQIENHDVVVEMYGGKNCELNKKIRLTGLVVDVNNSYYYKPERINSDSECVLADEILGIPNFREDDALIVVPFKIKGWSDTSYELLLLSDDGDAESIFCTGESPYEDLQLYARMLYDEMREQEFDINISLGIKKMIMEYLSDK